MGWVVEVDEKDKLVGKILRSDAHKPDNLHRHREVMVLIYADRNKETFWLQKRSMTKDHYPGLWTLSATGHVEMGDCQAGEGYLEAAVRETEEEMGLSLVNPQLMGKIELKLDINWAMMGVVVGNGEGKIRLNKHELEKVKIFNRMSVLEVSDKLTPNAKVCLEYLKLIK